MSNHYTVTEVYLFGISFKKCLTAIVRSFFFFSDAAVQKSGLQVCTTYTSVVVRLIRKVHNVKYVYELYESSLDFCVTNNDLCDQHGRSGQSLWH